MTTTNHIEIAETILAKLGGRRFKLMTGSKNFTAMGDGLRMDLAKNVTVANRCQITLTPADTYDIVFYKLNRTQLARSPFRPVIKEIAKFEGIYCDQLAEIFTSVTGLYTKLGGE